MRKMCKRFAGEYTGCRGAKKVEKSCTRKHDISVFPNAKLFFKISPETIQALEVQKCTPTAKPGSLLHDIKLNH